MFHVLYLMREGVNVSVMLKTGQKKPNENELHNFYRLVRQFKDRPEPEDVPAFLESIFVEMQAEKWSPNGEQRELLEGLGLSHTSISAGDVVYDGYNHRLWLCAGMSWEAFEIEDLASGYPLTVTALEEQLPIHEKHPRVQGVYIGEPPDSPLEQFYATNTTAWSF